MTGKFNTTHKDGYDPTVRAEAEERIRQRGSTKANGGDGDAIDWPEPKSLPDGLAPVAAFRSDFLPGALAPWVDDIGERLQCPPDYPAIAAMTGLGSVLGRRLGIRPQMNTEWTEVSNLWGGFVGRPGMLKSPAMTEALRPVHRLEAEAAKENEVAQQAYEAGLNFHQIQRAASTALAKATLKKNPDAEIKLRVDDEPQPPKLRRFRTNDTTYEKLGAILIDNPTGLLIERDELVSLLSHLEREDQSVARGFYLSGWSGSMPYTFDRIQRGTLHLDAVCLSVLGNTQPARIADYARRANAGATGGDGLIQRFGLFAWPDAPADWADIDRPVDPRMREAAYGVYDRVAKIDKQAALSGLGALVGPYDKVPWLRFDEDAHAAFLSWREDLERRVRSGEMSPALEAHLAKYRKLVPALALMNHIADAPTGGAVALPALQRALAFAAYLETHARRLYQAGGEIERTASAAILRRIRRGEIQDGFSARDILRHGWSNLTDAAHVHVGLGLLCDLDQIAAKDIPSGIRGGRPRTVYLINPRQAAHKK